MSLFRHPAWFLFPLAFAGVFGLLHNELDREIHPRDYDNLDQQIAELQSQAAKLAFKKAFSDDQRITEAEHAKINQVILIERVHPNHRPLYSYAYLKSEKPDDKNP
jgi:hypothetical protein